jgi:23S rRNA (uracil1939-C5)-methyltransferase
LSETGTFKIIIDSLVYGGAGLGRHEGKVVFVPFSVPGDHLLVRPVEEKKKFTRAEIVRILEPGPGRIAPVCSHFMKCGGCHWQQLDYMRQVDAKRKILEETLHHRFVPRRLANCQYP